MSDVVPHVVYHVAAMGDWRDVVKEQLALLRHADLTDVDATFVGVGLDWLLAEAKSFGVNLNVVRSDPNVLHYETFAMLHIEHLAKVQNTDRPILYLHTKGVSAPGHQGKAAWRRLMGEYVVRRWRENLPFLTTHDAVGVNWWSHGEQHFSGTFWMANPDWIRKLPDFVGYHAAKNFIRYSCEMWIGAMQWCRAKTLVCSNQEFWKEGYPFHQFGDFSAPLYGRTAYHNLTMQQAEGILTAIPDLIHELRPARVLEVGTGQGGLSVLIRHALDGLGLRHVPVVTLDVEERPTYAAVRREGVDVRVGQFFSFDYWACDPSIMGFIQGPGRTLVLCDGGSKAGEFRTLSSLLKTWDVICAHDYAPDVEHFERHKRGKTWDWLEFQDKDAEQPMRDHGLVPYPHRGMTAAHWFCALCRAPKGRKPVDVTVVIPTIPARKDLLLRALSSVTRQTVAPRAVVECDRRGEGAAVTRDRGLRKVETDWVAFLDDDDEFYPDHIESLLSFAGETKSDFVFSYFDRAVEGRVNNDYDVLQCFGREFDPQNPHQATVTVLVKTEIAQAAGFKDAPPGREVEGLSLGEDYQFLLDCLALGAKVKNLHRRTWVYHVHPGNTSGRPGV